MIKIFLKKNKLAVFLFALLIVLTTSYLNIHFLDISMKTPAISKINNLKAYITFSNGGVHDANANYALSKAINKNFDLFISYKPKHIDKVFFESNKNILNQQRGAGYWLWKPYFILKTLELLPEGSIVMYNDAGISFTGNIDDYVKKMDESKKDLAFFIMQKQTNRHYIKKEIYRLMHIDEEYKDKLQLNASSIIVRKSDQSIQYIKKWLELCKDERLLTDKKFSDEPEDADFKDHRHDQSILTLLYYSNPAEVLILNKKKYDGFFHHRRRNINSYSLAIRHIKQNISGFIHATISLFKKIFISF